MNRFVDLAYLCLMAVMVAMVSARPCDDHPEEKKTEEKKEVNSDFNLKLNSLFKKLNNK